MPFATEPLQFTRCTTSYPAAPASDGGTLWTCGGNDADGSAVSLIAAVAHDVHSIRIRIGGVSSTGVDSNAAGDLLVDPSGGTSWSVLVSDLVCGFSNFTANGGMNQVYEFPLYIASGSSIGWRGKTVHTADISGTAYVVVEAWGDPTNPAMWWCGQGVETLGISDSKGTSITPGNSGVAGSWTSVGSTTTRLYRAIQLGVNGSDSTALGVTYHFEIGADSQKLPGTSKTWLNMNSSEAAFRQGSGLMRCNVPSGTQMQVRATCSGTAENFYAAAYGVY